MEVFWEVFMRTVGLTTCMVFSVHTLCSDQCCSEVACYNTGEGQEYLGIWLNLWSLCLKKPFLLPNFTSTKFGYMILYRFANLQFKMLWLKELYTGESQAWRKWHVPTNLKYHSLIASLLTKT